MAEDRLVARIRRLEGTVRNQRAILTLLLVVAASAIAMGQVAPKPIPSSVVAKEFRVVDEGGKTRAILGPLPDRSIGLGLFDERGGMAWQACAEKEEAVEKPSAREIMEDRKARTVCMNNMREVLGLLISRQATRRLRFYSGSAFVLQVAPLIRDENLTVFRCPGDSMKRSKLGPGVVELYRNAKLPADGTLKLTSYAGPNWKDYPLRTVGREAGKSRLWICDACPGGKPHHRGGICVGYSSGKVEFIPIKDLKGHDPAKQKIIVGPDSPDPRLKMMTVR
jgi:hypothetical protein